MNNLLKCELVMLPANQKAIGNQIYKYDYTNKSELKYHSDYKGISGNINAQHLYIISDREIKDDDWCIDLRDNTIFKSKLVKGAITTTIYNRKWGQPNVIIGEVNNGRFKKIEATTDPELILTHDSTDDGFGLIVKVPQIPESFIQAYIKNYNLGTKIEECYLECEKEFTGYNEHKMPWIIKTRNDNTVIIHQIKDKFTRDEVLDIIETYAKLSKRVKYLDVQDGADIHHWFNTNY